MPETIFLQTGNVLVTNARVKIGADTYPLANITSYKARYSDKIESNEEKISRWRRFLLKWGAVVGLFIGAIVGTYLEDFTKKVLGIDPGSALGDFYAKTAGAIVTFAIAYVALFKLTRIINFKRPFREYHVKFGTSNGEIEAISSRDEVFIDGFIAALDKAVAHR